MDWLELGAQQTSMPSPRAVPEWLSSPVWHTKPTHPLQAEEGTRSNLVLNGDYEGSPTEATYDNEGKEEGNGCANILENEEMSGGAQSSSLDNVVIQKTSSSDQSSFGRSTAFDTRVGLFIVEVKSWFSLKESSIMLPDLSCIAPMVLSLMA